MSDKARYVLEKCVPELKDMEKKGLFNKRELTMIMRRRTDFEHRIAGRGSKPVDYLQYTQYERNIQKLKNKRSTRKKDLDTTPSVSDWAGPKHIMFIFERATNKFPQSMELWSQYLKFARKQNDLRSVYEVYSKLLSLQPRNVDVWLSGAKWEFESNKNVNGARTLFKRCIRFNSEEPKVWKEFIKFELNYLSKLLVRRKLFNLISEKEQLADLEENELENKEFKFDDISKDELSLEMDNLPEFNVSTLGSIEENPVLKGQLIITLYDVAIDTLLKKIKTNGALKTDKEVDAEKMELSKEFTLEILHLVDQFDILDRTYICDHIIQDFITRYPNDIEGNILRLTLSLRFVTIENSNFVNDLQTNVKLYQAWISKSSLSNEVKEDVKKGYMNYLNERYTQFSSGETKTLLELLIKRLA